MERFEKQATAIPKWNDLVKFFCTDVIPLFLNNTIIEPLRNAWRLQRDQWHQKLQELEARALVEIEQTFREVQVVVKNSKDKSIKHKMSVIEGLVTGQKKVYGTPLSYTLSVELKQLFSLLLKTGNVDLCQKYAKLATSEMQVIDPNPPSHKKWVLVLGKHQCSYFPNMTELKKACAQGKDVRPAPTAFKLIKETYIEEFHFAPTVTEVFAAREAINKHQFTDPAIVWWYFEGIYWLWNTSETYFDQFIIPKNGEDPKKHFHTMLEKSSWREIAASAKGPAQPCAVPFIFTRNLFLSGLTTLINSVNAYLAHNIEPRSIQPTVPPSASFTLVLDGNELWVKITFQNQETESFYIQRFHEDADPEGSAPFRFVKDLLKVPHAGKRKANLRCKRESASGHINRIHLPQVLKALFFGKSHGSFFEFKGVTVEVFSDIADIVAGLRKRHAKRRG